MSENTNAGLNSRFDVYFLLGAETLDWSRTFQKKSSDLKIYLDENYYSTEFPPPKKKNKTIQNKTNEQKE